jgi:chromosome segregation ATPase
MDEQVKFELQEWQERVDGLHVALASALEERDNLRDAAASLVVELDKTKNQLKTALSIVDRLRLHIQQGVEL